MSFNPNELVLEKIRAVEEYDPATSELIGRYTMIESPSLQVTKDSTEVTDAMGASIAEFFQAAKGTFSFSNSLFSLDLLASQFGVDKTVATDDNTFTKPVSEVITVGADHTVTLKYVPVGTSGAEVKYVKVINTNQTFGATYQVSATAGDGKFTLNAATKKITLPNDVTGKVFVNYKRAVENGAKISVKTDTSATVKELLVYAIFHDPCNTNLVYEGVIYMPRAQTDQSSIDVTLTPDGKHAASYNLKKPYCDDAVGLFDIMVSED